MSDVISNLPNRLRTACIGHPYARIPWPHRVLHEAADEIDALRAQARAGRDREYHESELLTATLNSLKQQLDAVTRERDQLQQQLRTYDKEVEELYAEQTANERQQLARYRAALAEDQVENYLRQLVWTSYAQNIDRTLVDGNIRAFAVDRRHAAEGGEG